MSGLDLPIDQATLAPPAHQGVVEVRAAEIKPNRLEIDPKNPVFILRKKVSGNVGEIIHIAENGVVAKTTTEQVQSLKSEQEKHKKYHELHAEVDNDFVPSKLNDILGRPRKLFLESHIHSLYNGKFDSENNIVIGGARTVKKGSPEYDGIIKGALEGLRMVTHAMLRKSEADGTDPGSIRKNLTK